MTAFKKLRYFIEALCLRLLALLFSLLPWNMAVKTGGILGRLSTKIASKRFELTKDNIRRALPNLSAKEVERTALLSWENLGVILAEVIQASHMDAKQLSTKCVITNPHVLFQLRKEGKSALIHLGHFANWELTATAMTALGLPTAAMAKHIRNPYVDKMVDTIRRKFGMDIVYHHDPFFSCVRHLKRGYFLGILMDQNYPAGEIYAPFFGRMASTTPLTALLALKTGTPILPLHVTRKDGLLLATFEEAIYPDDTYSPQAMHALIDKLNARLESWIRKEPHLWLWAHNRWKREADALVYIKEHGGVIPAEKSHEPATTK